jgi:HSP20 family protein
MANISPSDRNRGRGGPGVSRSHPLARLHDEFDDTFRRFFGGWPAAFPAEFEEDRLWDFGVTEEDDAVVVRAEVPGFAPEDIDVNVQNDVLTIQAEQKQEQGREGNQGRGYALYRRSVTLPPGTDPEKVEARYRHGVLEVHIPRSPQSVGRRIPVRHEAQGQAGAAPKQEAAARPGKGDGAAAHKGGAPAAAGAAEKEKRKA